MNAKTSRGTVPLRERHGDPLGCWTTVHCPNPGCSLRTRFRHASESDGRCYRELSDDQTRRRDAA